MIKPLNFKPSLVAGLALAWFLVLSSCGSQQSLNDSARARPPVKTQNQGAQAGANNPASPITPQSTPQDPEIKRFAFDASSLKNPSRKISGTYFDYVYGLASLHATVPKIRVMVTNSELTQLGANLGVVIAGYPMNDSASFISSNTAANLDSQGLLTIKGENFKPATVYKLKLHFFDLSSNAQSQTQGQTQAQPRYLGASSQSYQMVTDGENNPLASARAHIVMRGFGEVYDWSLGRYDRQKGYTMNSGGGWCHVFYNWTIKPDLKTRSGTDHTHYDPNYWSSFNAKTTGNELIKLSQSDMIHGDYFRTGSHAAMIVAYDKARSEFVTLEGNFNNSVQMYQRNVSDFSWVGHITKEMMR